MTRSIRLNWLLLFLAAFSPADGAQFYDDWAATNFAENPSQAGATNDPDGDGENNLVEFAFGTNPLAPGGITGAINPLFGSPRGTNGLFSVEIFERAGHQPGVQIDLCLAQSLAATNWFHPWWLRTNVTSRAGDPAGSVRENCSTYLPGTNIWFVRASVQLIEAGAETAKYYVATNGSDSNPGTNISAPFATLGKATGLANSGNLIYVRGGNYHFTTQVSTPRGGTPERPIRVRAFPGEHPVLDFAAEADSDSGISLSKAWWQVYGLEIVHAGHNGIKITGSSNIVERCVVHESGDTGIHITTGGGNLVLNCDSYRNYDPPIGGNADGFSAKFPVGPGNVFRNCRSWFNSDDGWDLWEATNAVVLDHCMTWSNGFNVYDSDPGTNTAFNGNGNGFKLGGNYYFGSHVISHCISFGNKVNGYDQNNNTAGLTVDNCIGWANGARNFQLNHGTNITSHIIRNNVSFAGASADAFRSGSVITHNSWQILSPDVNAADFLSTNTADALAPRRDDGNLPETPFLRPVPGGRLVNKGVDIGESYHGSAPDLGAYETPEW
ncbi:MAG TPA: right-handed parallel beta-helix repeat-containing protein [Verrucomicrobiae bacterium]|nr:right-handed parallel beta-helix repeat-containing protein [Verrucomicrobiae bacterium]